MKSYWSAVGVLMLSACAATIEDTATTDASSSVVATATVVEMPPPKLDAEDDAFGAAPAQPVAAIERWFQSELAAPEQTSFVYEAPHRGHFGEEARFGWVVATWVQEGDQDPRLYHCWFRDDELVAVLDPSRMPSYVEIASR